MTETKFLQIFRAVNNVGAIAFALYGMRHTMELSAVRWCLGWLLYALVYKAMQYEFRRLIAQARRAERRERIAEKRKVATSLRTR